MQPRFEAVAACTDRVCREKLNQEWAVLCRELAAALARKRPSPLLRGKPEVWAAGILHALGVVNFLFDRSLSPSLESPRVVHDALGVSYASMQAKSKFIRDLFQMMRFDPEWTAPSRMDHNPLAWLLMVNGLPMDVRYAPREVQEEALRRGLIPYRPPRPEPGARCGLCGATENLTRTECCGQWICDDESEYVLFSFARNSCYRNHDRYTLCSHHFNEGHSGRWQDCARCRDEFETEMYV